MAELLRSTWSDAVSNDPKHRPQVMDWPSTTVRKEWCRRPQEAHVVDGKKIRRMSVAEIAAIQGFPAEWVNVDGITDSERIAVLGNAVPPPLSHVLANLLKDNIEFQNKTLIEICAGIGGLSSGFDYLTPIAKIELWDVAAKILRTNKPWPSECVVEGYAQQFDYEQYRGKVGLLCGGPPCQPWSMSGRKKGAADPRDVMGFTPTAIAACEPEVFLFLFPVNFVSNHRNRQYAMRLLDAMNRPKEGMKYGLAVREVNAADYGLAQIREYYAVLGIQGISNTKAYVLFDLLKKYQTHHNPNTPFIGMRTWMTLGELFGKTSK